MSNTPPEPGQHPIVLSETGHYDVFEGAGPNQLPVGDEIPERPNWLRRNGLKLAVGTSLGSLALTLATDPFHDTVEHLRDAAPYVIGGMVVSEVAWNVGAGMMVAAVGNKIWNPLKIKKRIPEIASQAKDSLLFKAGLVTNTVAAIGQSSVLATGVITEMPVKSWGLLGLAATDLWATMAVRRGIVRGIRNNTV